MAYVADDKNQQQIAQGQAPNPLTQQAPITTATAPGSGPGAGKTGSQSPGATPSQPFSNLQDYLSANKEQLNTQGQKIAGELTNQYGQAKQGIDTAAQNFGSNVAAGYTPYNADVVNRAATTPGQFIQNPSDVNTFSNIWSGNYTGPSNFESSEGYKTAQGNAQKATDTANLVNTFPGLQQYLQGQNPTVTQGQSILDTSLLATSPEAYKQVTSAAAPFNKLSDYLGTTTTTQDKAVQDAIKTAQANAANVQNQFTGKAGVIPTYGTNLQNQTTAAQQKAQAAIDAEKNFLGTANDWNGLNSNELNPLGINMDQYNNLVNLQNYIRQYGNSIVSGPPPSWDKYFNAINPTADITQANVATPEQYADIAALQKLTGQDLSSYLDQGNISKAGTAPTDYYNLNYPQFNTDLQNLVDTIMASLPAGKIPIETKTSPGVDVLQPVDTLLGGPGDIANKAVNYATSPITDNIPGTSELLSPVNTALDILSNPVQSISNPGQTIGNIGQSGIDLVKAPLDIMTGGNLQNISNTVGNTLSDVGSAIGSNAGNVAGAVTAPLDLMTGGALSGIGNTLGLGGSTGVGNQWNDQFKSQVDPLIQHIMDVRGAPHGKAPEQWWNPVEMDRAIKDYIYSLPADKRASYLQNLDTGKLSADMQKIYGQGWDFSTYKTSDPTVLKGYTQGPVSSGTVRAF